MLLYIFFQDKECLQAARKHHNIHYQVEALHELYIQLLQTFFPDTADRLQDNELLHYLNAMQAPVQCNCGQGQTYPVLRQAEPDSVRLFCLFHAVSKHLYTEFPHHQVALQTD